jgi:hypothetical protein
VGVGDSCLMMSFYNFYSEPNVIRVVKSRWMNWAGLFGYLDIWEIQERHPNISQKS